MINKGMGRCELILQTQIEVLMRCYHRKGKVSEDQVIPGEGKDVTQRQSSKLMLMMSIGLEDRRAEPPK